MTTEQSRPRRWTATEIEELRGFIKLGWPANKIARKLKRSDVEIDAYCNARSLQMRSEME